MIVVEFCWLGVGQTTEPEHVVTSPRSRSISFFAFSVSKAEVKRVISWAFVNDPEASISHAVLA